MAIFWLYAISLSASALVSAVTAHIIKSKSSIEENRKMNEKLRKIEENMTKANEIIEATNKEKAAAEDNLSKMQEAYQAEQKKKAEDLNKEKEEMKKAQVERERLMEEKYEKWERKQKEMIDAEKQHQRILAEDAEKGLKRSHDVYERQMALGRELLAKEEKFLSNARREHERRQKEEWDRFKQSQTSCKRAMEEDRQRMAQEMNAFAEAQKKWDNDRAVLQQNYDKLQSKLNEGYQQLQRNQQAMEKRLQSQMENLMDEQKNLTDFEKEQKLKDLTVTFLDYCQMYSNDPAKLTKETEKFQRKLKLQLNKVKSSMTTGDESLPRLDVWTEGAMLDMTMLKYLYDRGEIKSEAIQAASQQYHRDMGALVSKFNASDALPCNVTELQAIQNSFDDRVQVLENSINRALPDSTSPLLDIQTPTARESSILSPAINEYATTGGGVSSVPSRRQVQLMSGNPTNGSLVEDLQESVLDDKLLPPGDASWARCDALAKSLRESILQDRSRLPDCTNSTRSDAPTQLLRPSAGEE